MKDIPYYQLSSGRQFRIFSLEEHSGKKFPHRHDFYEILWVRAGSGRHLIDFQEYSLSSRTIFFIKPGQINKFISDEIAGYVVEFNEEFFHQEPQDRLILAKFNQFHTIELSHRDEIVIGTLLDLIRDEYIAEDHNLRLVRTYLKALVINLSRALKKLPEPSAHDSDSERVANVKSLLEENFRARKNVIFYAESLHLSPKRLNEILKLKIGKTMTELIHSRLALEARRELAFSQLSVKEIAIRLGFQDPAYFSRFFKRTTGLYPQDY